MTRFPHHQHPPASAPIESGPRRPEPASKPESAVIACTLTRGEQASRIGQWRRLLAGAEPEAIEHGLRFRLPRELIREVAELASAEQRCCAFFEFVIRLDGGGLCFEVRAPAEAAPLLAEVFGTANSKGADSH